MHCESNTAASQETAVSAFSLTLASGKLLLQKKKTQKSLLWVFPSGACLRASREAPKDRQLTIRRLKLGLQRAMLPPGAL